MICVNSYAYFSWLNMNLWSSIIYTMWWLMHACGLVARVRARSYAASPRPFTTKHHACINHQAWSIKQHGNTTMRLHGYTAVSYAELGSRIFLSANLIHHAIRVARCSSPLQIEHQKLIVWATCYGNGAASLSPLDLDTNHHGDCKYGRCSPP